MEETMVDAGRLKYLRVALAAVGVIFIVGIYSLVVIWPSAGRGIRQSRTTCPTTCR
jgi:hypothetical protein